MNENDNTTSNVPPEETEQVEAGGAPLSQIALNIMDKLGKAIPLLDDNLAIATIIVNNQHNPEYQRMTPNQYNEILQRNRDANLAISSIDFDEGTLTDKGIAKFPNYEQRLTDIAAWCIIDLREHVTMDLKNEEQKEALNMMQELLELLQYAGYTKIHPMFKIPMKP